MNKRKIAKDTFLIEIEAEKFAHARGISVPQLEIWYKYIPVYS